MSSEVSRVLVTGVFDVLHPEHIIFLKKARSLGKELLVYIESDVRVRQIKGQGRPINGQLQRKVALEQLGIADRVEVLPDCFSSPADHRALLAQVQPDVLAVSEHTAHLDKKQALMQEVGGRVVVVHAHNPRVSTTQLLGDTAGVK